MKKKMLAFLMAVLIVVGIFPVTAMADEEVAQIGTIKYATLQAAIENAQDGDTVTLLKSVTDGTGVKIGNSKFSSEGLTIDFDNYTYTATGSAVGSSGTENQMFHFVKGNKITMKNGTIAVGGSTECFRMVIQNYSDLALEKMTIDGTNLYCSGRNDTYTVSNNCGETSFDKDTVIKASTHNGTNNYALDVDWQDRDYPEGAQVTVNGSTIIGAISTNELGDKGYSGKSELTIKGGSFTDLANAVKYAESGATIKLAEDVTIDSQLNIDKAITLDGNGKKITRTPGGADATYKAGILVTAGATIKNLTVSGPNSQTAATAGADGRKWDSGEFGIKLYEATDAVLDTVTVTGANAGIQVNGGSVTMENNITVSGNEFGGIELCHGGELDLTNATLVNEDETDANPVLWNDDNKGTITFNEAQALYIRAVDEDKDHYYLDCEAKINETNYRTLAAAIAAVKDNETITMVANVNNAAGISVNTGKTFTVDFAGHTYTVNKPGAGSTGTQTQAFQLIAGQTITFKNGTINASEDNLTLATSPQKNIKRFFQSYANVTFDNMTIDGTNIYGENSVMEFANGTVSITGNTSIKAKSGVDAITVDTWKGAYPNGAHVTINTTGTIGDIYAYSEESGNFEKSSLTIQGGTFGTVSGDSSKDYTISISGGIFSSKPDDAYIKNDYFAKKLSNTEWKVEPKAKVEDNEIKIGEGTVTVESTGEGGPEATKVAEKINEVLAYTVVPTFEEANIEAATEDLEITDLKDVTEGIIEDKQVNVKLKSVKVEGNNTAFTITRMEFDVKPKAVVTKPDGSTTEADIPNNKIKAPITFRLPVDGAVTATTVAVYHNGVLMGTYPIHSVIIGGTGIETDYEKYIEVQSKEFSTFAYELLDATNSTAKIDGVYYKTLANAIEKASGKTVTIIKDTDEVVTVERAMNFKLVVEDDVEFTGAIKPGDDYVRHIYGDKYYFELYEAGDTIVIGGKKDKDTKTETKEENPETGAPVMNMGVLAVLAVAYVATRKH